MTNEARLGTVEWLAAELARGHLVERARLAALVEEFQSLTPEGDALGFIQAVSAMPGLRLRGLLSHAGHGYHAASEEDLACVAQREAAILTGLRERAAGIDVRELVPIHGDFNLDLCRLGPDGMRAHLAEQLAPSDLARFSYGDRGSDT